VQADETWEQPRAAVVDAQTALPKIALKRATSDAIHEVAPEREGEPPPAATRSPADGGLADVAQRGRAPPDAAHVAKASPVPRGHAESTRSAPAQKPLARAGDHEHAVVAVAATSSNTSRRPPHIRR